jgi:hypothetical protein
MPVVLSQVAAVLAGGAVAPLPVQHCALPYAMMHTQTNAKTATCRFREDGSGYVLEAESNKKSWFQVMCCFLFHEK